MEKKTLEEAAEIYTDFWLQNKGLLIVDAYKEGAKWQQQGYSEEEVRKAQQAILCNIKDALQDENYIIEYLEQFKKK